MNIIREGGEERERDGKGRRKGRREGGMRELREEGGREGRNG